MTTPEPPEPHYALNVTCPFCGAPKGERCRNGGVSLLDPHTSRVERYQGEERALTVPQAPSAVSPELTVKQAREVATAIRHIGRAMKALDRAKLPVPRAHDPRWTWQFDKGHRALLDASDKLIDGMEAAETDRPATHGDPT